MAEWIEIRCTVDKYIGSWSPLAMAEWIEIVIYYCMADEIGVSASDGGVD